MVNKVKAPNLISVKDNIGLETADEETIQNFIGALYRKHRGLNPKERPLHLQSQYATQQAAAESDLDAVHGFFESRFGKPSFDARKLDKIPLDNTPKSSLKNSAKSYLDLPSTSPPGPSTQRPTNTPKNPFYSKPSVLHTDTQASYLDLPLNREVTYSQSSPLSFDRLSNQKYTYTIKEPPEWIQNPWLKPLRPKKEKPYKRFKPLTFEEIKALNERPLMGETKPFIDPKLPEGFDTRPPVPKNLVTPVPTKPIPKENLYQKLKPSSKQLKIGGGILAAVLATSYVAGVIASRQTYQEKRHTNLETKGGQEFKKKYNLPFEAHSKVVSTEAALMARNLLGLNEGYTEKDIKSAHRKLASEWHPDRNRSPGAAEKMVGINNAKEDLLNHMKYGSRPSTRSYSNNANSYGSPNNGHPWGSYWGGYSRQWKPENDAKWAEWKAEDAARTAEWEAKAENDAKNRKAEKAAKEEARRKADEKYQAEHVTSNSPEPKPQAETVPNNPTEASEHTSKTKRTTSPPGPSTQGPTNPPKNPSHSKPSVLHTDTQASETFEFGTKFEEGLNNLKSEFKERLSSSNLKLGIGAGVLVAGLGTAYFLSNLKTHRSKHKENDYHEIAEKSDHMGSSMAYGLAFAKSMPFAREDYNSHISSGLTTSNALKNTTKSFFANIEESGGINLHVYGASALAYSLVKGKTAEEKAQGLSVYGREYSASKIGGVLAHYAEKFLPESSRGAGAFLTHTVSTVAISHIAAPYFNWGAARIGRILNFSASNKAEEGQRESSYANRDSQSPEMSSVNETTRIKDGNNFTRATNGSARVNNRISDQRISNRDVDEAQARKLSYGRAF